MPVFTDFRYVLHEKKGFPGCRGKKDAGRTLWVFLYSVSSRISNKLPTKFVISSTYGH